MSSTATKEATKPETQPLLKYWVDFRVLGLMGLGNPATLESQAEQAGIEIDRSSDNAPARFWFSEEADDIKTLESFLGPAVVQQVLGYKPAWGPVLKPDRAKLNVVDQVHDADILALAELRGVLVQGDRVDRRGLERLGELLAAERRFPTGHDWILGDIAIGYIRNAMVTEAVWEAPPPPPPVYVPPIWSEPNRNDTRRFIKREAYDPDEELVNRCKYIDIRVGKPAKGFDRGRKWVLGFDLYRRLGIVLGGHLMPSQSLDAYRETMTQAYDGVFSEK